MNKPNILQTVPTRTCTTNVKQVYRKFYAYFETKTFFTSMNMEIAQKLENIARYLYNQLITVCLAKSKGFHCQKLEYLSCCVIV